MDNAAVTRVHSIRDHLEEDGVLSMQIIFVEICAYELTHQPLICSIRNTCSALRLSSSSVLNFLYDLQSETPNVMLDYRGRRVLQDLSVFEATDNDILFENGLAKEEAIRVWFRDHFLSPLSEGIAVNYTEVGQERFQAAANVIGTAMPGLSRDWPRLVRIDPANDNFIGFIADNDNAPPS